MFSSLFLSFSLQVPLIEKALAKLNGTYESIIAGRCCEGLSLSSVERERSLSIVVFAGLSIVTGSPCETLFLGQLNDPDNKDVDHDDLWQRLVNAHRRKFLMCAMCHNKQMKKEDFHRLGLLNIHAYSFQDLQEINSPSSSDTRKDRFVKLRNPWGANQRHSAKRNQLQISSSSSPSFI